MKYSFEITFFVTCSISWENKHDMLIITEKFFSITPIKLDFLKC